MGIPHVKGAPSPFGPVPRLRAPTVARQRAHPAEARASFYGARPEEIRRVDAQQKRLLITDTTFRDAHQSLLATRVRSYDMVAIADA